MGVKDIKTETHVKEHVKEWYVRVGGWSYAPIQNGMGQHGIHDRVGVVPMVVTPEMVGKTIGLFVSVESKKPGRRGELRRGMSVHQHDMLTDVRARGGVSICCDGLEDLANLENELHTIQYEAKCG